MKNKTKIEVIAIAIAITSLMITVYHPGPLTPTESPQIVPLSEIVEIDRASPPTYYNRTTSRARNTRDCDSARGIY